LKLATWWCPLAREQKERYLDHTKVLEKNLVQAYNKIKSKFEEISEEEEDSPLSDIGEVCRGLQ
jgi:hypothetical protein